MRAHASLPAIQQNVAAPDIFPPNRFHEDRLPIADRQPHAETLRRETDSVSAFEHEAGDLRELP